MFAAISGAYDFNNRVHSLGLDQTWRRRTVKLAQLRGGETVVDVACGTGDLSLAFAGGLKKLGSGGRVIGVDFTYEMLPIARKKTPANSPVPVAYLTGDAMALPLPDACCDVVSIAFGIRNVADVSKALGEFRRVLKPGGRLLVLEFSQPRNKLIRWGNAVYCKHIMPHTATALSGDKSGAYKYLPMSVDTFMEREVMEQKMRDAGFADVSHVPMTFGVVVCYRGALLA